MVAAFPACEPSSKLLVENFPRLDVFELRRAGLLAEGALWVVDLGNGGSQPATRRVGILEIGDQVIRLHSHRTIAAEVFSCPICGADKYVLSLKDGRWACRACHGLSYACRHHQTVPWRARIAFLRRRLHADPTPFSPLPVKRNAPKHFKLCCEVRRLEAALITHARDDIAAVLEKRYARHYRRRAPRGDL